jgi:hypothetical protein
MLKTNCKIVNDQIDNYILDCLEDALQENEINRENKKAAFQFLYDDFLRVESWQLVRSHNLQSLFEFYMMGLPFNFNYYDSRYGEGSAKAILKDFLQQTDEEADKYSYEKAEKTLSYLILKRVQRFAKIGG